MYDLSTGISNLLQPAKAEVMLGQLSTYLASWRSPTTVRKIGLIKKLKTLKHICQTEGMDIIL
jgi:hypothetical protein